MTASADVLTRLRSFVAARDWEKFHTTKNLAAGLAIEAAEVQELFLWLGDVESSALDSARLTRLREEIGDVQLFLFNLADKFGWDPLDCALAKLALNERKYPPEKARGNAKKYDEF